MKQKLLFAVVLCLASYASFSQEAFVQKMNAAFSYSNYSKYRLNPMLVAQGIPEIKTNRFSVGIVYEFYFKDWMTGGRFSNATGKNEENNITTKTRLFEGELQLGHKLLKTKDFGLYAGLGVLGATNTVTIFQEPKPTISLNNLLGANNNLVIKNDSYNAGIFLRANLFENKDISPYIAAGYYMPIVGTEWKADEAEIVDNVKEKPFIFNLTIGISLFDF